MSRLTEDHLDSVGSYMLDKCEIDTHENLRCTVNSHLINRGLSKINYLEHGPKSTKGSFLLCNVVNVAPLSMTICSL